MDFVLLIWVCFTKSLLHRLLPTPYALFGEYMPLFSFINKQHILLVIYSNSSIPMKYPSSEKEGASVYHHFLFMPTSLEIDPIISLCWLTMQLSFQLFPNVVIEMANSYCCFDIPCYFISSSISHVLGNSPSWLALRP